MTNAQTSVTVVLGAPESTSTRLEPGIQRAGTMSEFDGKTCQATGCSRPWATAVPTGDIRLSLRQAIFDIDMPHSYEEWQKQGHTIQMCREHYRLIHRKDGVTLGYRVRNGKISAYVKEEHFGGKREGPTQETLDFDE